MSKEIKESSIDLNLKIDEFINWYYENMVKDKYTSIGEYHKVNDMRNIIEKMAVWYEIRYPDYEVNKVINCSFIEDKDINDIMFDNNQYINDNFFDNSDVFLLDWSELYNTRVFINSLPWHEKYLFQKPCYRSIMYLVPTKSAPFNLYLTRDGIIERCEGLDKFTNGIITDSELEGMYIRDVLEFLSYRGIYLDDDNEIGKVISEIDRFNYQKEAFLDSVMYRIIERGGNRIGPRRGFMFAKEFNRDISIPMKYGVDYSDPYLRNFINEYLKCGGSKDLECYIGYFFSDRENNVLDVISICDLLIKQNNSSINHYTLEEILIYQRLVNLLSSQIDYDEVEDEKIRKLRLERRLNKSGDR